MDSIPSPAGRGALEVPAEVYVEAFNSAPDGILIVSQSGEILYANPRCETLFGYGEADLVGTTIESLIPEGHRGRHSGHRAGFHQNPARRPMNAGLELYALRKDGTQFPAEISLSPTHLGDTPVVIATVRNVTEAVQLRAFGAGTLRAAENERHRIAQELHDDTAQRLVAVQLGLKRLETAPEEERGGVGEALRQEIAAIARDVSRIARGLRPPELEQIGVVESVRAWLRHRIDADGPTVDLQADPMDGLLDADQRLVLYRIIQEAVSNVVRHASARHLKVRLRVIDGVIETRVVDDGVGFDPTRPSGFEGLGLLGMRERAAMVGALVSITSQPGQGTQVRVAMRKREE